MLTVLAIWYALGLAGAFLLWFERTCWKWSSPPLKFLCPSPRVIILCVLGALLGPVIFITGVLVVAFSSDVGKNSWWNRPVCK